MVILSFIPTTVFPKEEVQKLACKDRKQTMSSPLEATLESIDFQCPCEQLGCTFRSNNDIEVTKHVESKCHYSAICKQLEKQRCEISKLKNENELLRKQLRKQRGDERPNVNLKRTGTAKSSAPSPVKPVPSPPQNKLLTTKNSSGQNRTISPNIDLSKPIILTPTNMYEQFGT